MGHVDNIVDLGDLNLEQSRFGPNCNDLIRSTTGEHLCAITPEAHIKIANLNDKVCSGGKIELKQSSLLISILCLAHVNGALPPIHAAIGHDNKVLQSPEP